MKTPTLTINPINQCASGPYLHSLVMQSALLASNDETDNINLNRNQGIPIMLQQVAALLGLLLISPFLLLIAIILKLESKGPVLFTQTRVGHHGARFKFYKFRSMYLPNDPKFRQPCESDSDREGVCKKYYNDPRITKFGKFMRKFSIDEIPQLYNVVLKDMALIGPRPALPTETNEYKLPNCKRLDCIPGITGLWQVSGRADLSFDEQMNLDNRYVDQKSFWLDVTILFKTVHAVYSARGAY